MNNLQILSLKKVLEKLDTTRDIIGTALV
ncbi:hypothetical protein LCGC14_2752760, partial [marine sediment metagenome]